MSARANQYMEAVRKLERERDVASIARMFAPDAQLKRAPRERVYTGVQGAHAFWAEYLDAFESIETHFGAVTESPTCVVLEWHSQAKTRSGHDVSYAGCSVFEGDGEQIKSFRTYYDAAAAGMGGAA
jgi:limonene-1,2-epoxide hydrolase